MRLPRCSTAWSWAIVLAIVVPAWAGEDLFPLASKIPQDVFFLHAGRHNPKAEFLDKAWDDVFVALEKSGVLDEVWNLATGKGKQAAKDEDDDDDDAPKTKKKANKTEDVAERFRSLMKQVRWGDLASQEWVIAGRMRPPVPEFVVLMRVPSDRAEKNFAGLKNILKELSHQGGENLTLTDSDRDGATLITLSVKDVPIVLTIGRHENVIIFSMGGGLLNESINLLAGKDKSGLTSTGRFKDAFKNLPAAEDSMSFVDMANLFKGLRGMLGDAEKKTKDDEHSAAAVKALNALATDLDIIDFMAATTRTEGMRVFTESWTKLASGASKRNAYSVFAAEGHIDKFDKYVPREATDFSVSAGVDLKAAYKWIHKFVQDLPEGEAAWEKWDGVQTQIGFNVEKDLLSWLGSGSISVALKSSNPLMGSEPVLMFKVSDEEKAVEKIKTGISKLGEKIGSDEQPGLASTPTKLAGRKNFYDLKLQNPMMMMLAAQIQPVWGVSDGYLMVGLNKGGLRMCLETASGDHESIRKSPRFQKEALVPKESDGRLVSISFTDQSNLGETIGAALGQMGMVGMLANLNPQLAEGAEKLQSIATIAGKLIPVAAKLNFFLSESSYTTFDGAAWHTRSVSNYRKPSAGDKDDEDWGDDWGDKDKKDKKSDKTDDGKKHKKTGESGK